MKNKAAKAITILISVCMITGTSVGAAEFVSGTDVIEQNTEQFSDIPETDIPQTDIQDENEETMDLDPAAVTGTTRLTSTTFKVVIEPAKAVYTGEEQKPKVTLKSSRSNQADPQEGVDYQISYEGDFTNSGTTGIIISGLGKYTGSFTKTYKIEPRELTGCTVALDQESFIYDGEQKMPQVTVKDGERILTLNKDYTVKYSNNSKPSENALVTVTGIGNYGKYSRTIKKYFKIKEAARDISKCTMSVFVNNITYNGSEKKPSVTVKEAGKSLKAGTDYTVSYKDNIHAGTGTAIVTGRGKYFGTLEKTFQIKPRSLSGAAKVILSGPKIVYDGTEKRPAVTVKDGNILLNEGIDYKVSYKNNINAGTATVIVTGMGDYTSYKSKSYTINRADISQAAVVLSADSFRYDGKAKKPGVTVTVGNTKLSANTDYAVYYNNYTKPGNATVTVKGKGNYTGEAKKTYRIFVAQDIEKGELTLSEGSFVYDGTEKKPAVVLKVDNKVLTENKDYTVTYINNINAGSPAEVIVTGLGYYTGKCSKPFEILPRKINAATATLTQSSYVYTGKRIEPEITVTDNIPLVKGKDYVISGNSVNVGTAKATVTGIGNYTGSLTVTFKIQKKDGQIIAGNKTVNQGSKAINVADRIVTDGKVIITSSAPGIVQVSGNKFIPKSPGKATLTIRAKAGKNYKAVAEKKITVTVRPLNTKNFTVKAGKSKAEVSWTPAKSVSGYQVQYSTSADMENAKAIKANGSSQSITLKKLMSKNNYYIRIRTFKKVGGKNYYSNWSSVRKVTVK